MVKKMVKGRRMTKGIAKVRKNQQRHKKLNMPLIIFIRQTKIAKSPTFLKHLLFLPKIDLCQEY